MCLTNTQAGLGEGPVFQGASFKETQADTNKKSSKQSETLLCPSRKHMSPHLSCCQ